jgi:hypothetical protein
LAVVPSAHFTCRRRLAKEREAEDHLFGDKDKFVTAAYKKKLQEDQKWLAEERVREAAEKRDSVVSRGHMGDFYRRAHARSRDGFAVLERALWRSMLWLRLALTCSVSLYKAGMRDMFGSDGPEAFQRCQERASAASARHAQERAHQQRGVRDVPGEAARAGRRRRRGCRSAAGQRVGGRAARARGVRGAGRRAAGRAGPCRRRRRGWGPSSSAG